MRSAVTAEQFRLIWRLGGGEAIPMPIQAPARGRMANNRDRIWRELDRWWAENEDPALYAAVGDLRQAGVWLHLEAFPAGGKPIRGLLGVARAAEAGQRNSVLVMQDAVRAVRDGDDQSWFPDTAVDSHGWSLERGGDVRLTAEHTQTLLARMVGEVPEFRPGPSPALRAESSEPSGGGFTSGATTTSKSERIQALLGRPRALYGNLSASVPDGAGLRRVGALGWVVVTGEGGYLVHGGGDGAVSLRPASRGSLIVAAQNLLQSAESAADLV